MKNEAKVIATDGIYATVEVERSSACEGCHKSEDGQGCSVCTLMGGNRKFSATAHNKMRACVGDRVVIETKTERVMLYALLVFLLPVVVAILGFVVASFMTDRAVWQTVGAAIGFGLSFLGLFIYSRNVQKKRCDIEITEIIAKGTSGN